MEPCTSAGVTVKEPLSAAEAVSVVLCRGNRKASFLKNIGMIPCHMCAPMIQFQLQLDSEKKGGGNWSFWLMSTRRQMNMLTHKQLGL